jgi:hypothetical protein
LSTALGLNRQLAIQARQQQLLLRAAVFRQLAALWPLLDVQNLDDSFLGWAYPASQLVNRGHLASVGLAAQYLRAARADSAVPGPPTIVFAPPLEPLRTGAVLRITGPVAVKIAIGNGKDPAAAMQIGSVLSSGAATKLVLAGARDTVVGSVKADRTRPKWERIASPTACDFCAMLADRGSVYASEDTASFEAHGNCGCSAAVEYEAADTTDAATTTDVSQEAA